MSAPRREARRRAVDILYEADVTGTAPSKVLEHHVEAGEPQDAFTLELVTGVEGRLEEIDERIAACLVDWTVPRLAAVDRAVMRVATFELLTQDVSAAVAISEAVAAVKELSTDESGRFVNGVLGEIARGPR